MLRDESVLIVVMYDTVLLGNIFIIHVRTHSTQTKKTKGDTKAVYTVETFTDGKYGKLARKGIPPSLRGVWLFCVIAFASSSLPRSSGVLGRLALAPLLLLSAHAMFMFAIACLSFHLLHCSPRRAVYVSDRTILSDRGLIALLLVISLVIPPSNIA